MGDERWVKVPGTRGLYEVSDHGRVRSYHRNRWGKSVTPRILSCTPGSNGYPTVSLHVAGRRRSATVHEVVLESFFGGRPEGMECRHLDGDKSNNHISNIIYGTPTQNALDRVRHGRSANGQEKKTHCPRGHPYRGENLYVDRRGHRHCRACTGIKRESYQ